MSWLSTLLRNVAIRLGFIRDPELISLLVSDHPAQEAMQPGIIYIVGGPGYQKWAVFHCPRHNDEIIQLSLMTNRRPRWTITTDFIGRPTIHPSVRQLDGSFAHFWVRRGLVEWCADSGRKTTITHS